MATSKILLGPIPHARYDWVSGANYGKEAIVFHKGSSYIALSDNPSTEPPFTYDPATASYNVSAGWGLLAVGAEIVQETGDSQDKAMSQKAVTDALIASDQKLSELEKETNILSGLKECFNIIDNPNLFDGVTDVEKNNIGSAIVDLNDCTLHYRNGNSNAVIAIPLNTEIGKEYKLSFKSDFLITGQNTFAAIAEYIWASSGRFATVDTTDNNNNYVTFVARSTTTYFVIGVAWTIKEYTISKLSCYRTDVESATIKFENIDNKPYETPKIKARNLLGHRVI